MLNNLTMKEIGMITSSMGLGFYSIKMETCTKVSGIKASVLDKGNIFLLMEMCMKVIGNVKFNFF